MSFIHPINFLNAPIIPKMDNKDMFRNMLEHYKMAQEPEKLAREERMGQMQEKYAEPLTLAKLQEHQRKQRESSPEALKMKEDLIKAKTNKENAQAKCYEQGGRQITPEQRAWSSLPANQKNDYMAHGKGLGFDPVRTATLGAQGYSVEDLKQLATQEGRDISNYKPIHAATGANQTAIVKAEGGLAEIKVMEDLTKKWLAPYSGNLMWGHSPKQVLDSLSGKSDDDIGKFLAGRVLSRDIPTIMNQVTGGSTAHAALKEMREAALSEIKIFRPLVSKNQYRLMHKYLEEGIGAGANARIDTMKGMREDEKKEKKASEHFKEALDRTGLTEEDIQHMQQEYGVSREQIIKDYGSQ